MSKIVPQSNVNNYLKDNEDISMNQITIYMV